MNTKALLLALCGLVVAAFYALESYLSFQANGFTPPLLVKIALCGVGVYFFARNLVRIRRGAEPGT